MKMCSFFLLTNFGLFIPFLQYHQQPPGNVCGFYVVHHMVKAMELLSIADDPEVYLPSDGSYFPCLRTEIWMVILRNGMNDMIAVLCWHVGLLEIRFFEFYCFLSK